MTRSREPTKARVFDTAQLNLGHNLMKINIEKQTKKQTIDKK